MYRTNDMGLVAYLRYRGFEPSSTWWDERSCYWCYDDEGVELLTLVDTYNRGEARVDPAKYNRIFGEVKKALYADEDARILEQRG